MPKTLYVLVLEKWTRKIAIANGTCNQPKAHFGLPWIRRINTDTCKMKKMHIRKLMVFRMCVLRKILGVSRWARIKNVDIMQELGIDKDIVLNFSFFFIFHFYYKKEDCFRPTLVTFGDVVRMTIKPYCTRSVWTNRRHQTNQN